ncbi:hypothetical protein ACWC5C_03655 [Streptomyces sp. NPDC001700]
MALPTGRWWDAVRVEESIGERTLALLGDESGAVIQDRCNTFYWLILCGTASSWKLRQAYVLTAAEGVATYLGVPPADHLSRPGTHWCVAYSRDGYLTDPWLLYKALVHAVLTKPDTSTERTR